MKQSTSLFFGLVLCLVCITTVFSFSTPTKEADPALLRESYRMTQKPRTQRTQLPDDTEEEEDETTARETSG